MSNDIEQFIIDYLSSKGADIPADSAAAYNYVDAAIIDSFETLAFIMSLETEFAIKLTPEDLLDDNIRTIGGLSQLIENKRGRNS